MQSNHAQEDFKANKQLSLEKSDLNWPKTKFKTIIFTFSSFAKLTDTFFQVRFIFYPYKMIKEKKILSNPENVKRISVNFGLDNLV